jgi:glutamate-5-semialdehyde dehydrogenase
MSDSATTSSPNATGPSSAIEAAARAARDASRVLAALPTATKDAFLRDLADAIDARQAEVLAASAQDLDSARAAGLAAPKLARLGLTEPSLRQVTDGVRQIASLPDPVGAVVRESVVPSGLRVRRVRTPLGVICMIFEARPGVTIDAFALCFKAGNACLLKGGKEAAGASGLLASIARERLAAHHLPEAAIASIAGLDRETLRHLLTLDTLIDLVIPRGGHELIRFVAQHSKIPTIQHYQGVCHVYIEASADLAMARRVCLNGKVSAPATCNATECVLVDRKIAADAVPALVAEFVAAGVEVRGDPEVVRLAPAAKPASNDDFGKEFLDLIVAMRVIDGLDDAISHIQRFGSGHTEAIVTRDPAMADAFTRRVQSSCVLVNASTRFNDGYQLGLGAEIGISTTRLHAYGPMGLEELTVQRFVVEGDGQTRG